MKKIVIGCLTAILCASTVLPAFAQANEGYRYFSDGSAKMDNYVTADTPWSRGETKRILVIYRNGRDASINTVVPKSRNSGYVWKAEDYDFVQRFDENTQISQSMLKWSDWILGDSTKVKRYLGELPTGDYFTKREICEVLGGFIIEKTARDRDSLASASRRYRSYQWVEILNDLGGRNVLDPYMVLTKVTPYWQDDHRNYPVVNEAELGFCLEYMFWLNGVTSQFLLSQADNGLCFILKTDDGDVIDLGASLRRGKIIWGLPSGYDRYQEVQLN